MKFINHPRLARVSAAAIPVALLGLLSACVTPPPRTYAVPAPPPQRVFVYPAHGQSPEQTERDRYECHTWAVQQTGVDPSRADASAYERVIVQPSTLYAARLECGGRCSCRRHHWCDYRWTAQCGRGFGAGRRDRRRDRLSRGRQCAAAGAHDATANQPKCRRRTRARRFLSTCDWRVLARPRLYGYLRKQSERQ
jgi:hypothetical protein